jgi:hypothetical protein
MATIHFHETTTATPEQFVAALTDFGPGREELFGKLGAVIGTVGRRVLAKEFDKAIDTNEARNAVEVC